VRFVAKGASVLAVAGLLSFTAITPSSARNVHRSIFFVETPFGSLAWVKGALTRASARASYKVEDLSPEACVSMPGAGAQWFMINHRDSELEGSVGYFSVRILYNFEEGISSPEARTGLHLQRNANWFDSNGVEVKDDFDRPSEQIALTNDTFIQFHDPEMGQEASRASLTALEAKVGQWHMKPTKDAESTWADRYLYGPMLRAYLSSTNTAISARLIRFTATSSNSSREPVLFWLDPRGATSATILIDAPRHAYAGSRRVYTVMFGNECRP
jgi:hypothetical protein